MTLDVVVVTYRSAGQIASCLASVPQAVTRIVVENASGDDTPALAAALGCEVIVNSDNRGFGAAANQGAAAGTGDAVLFLNPDARLRPGTLDAMVRRLADPQVGVVGATLIHPDGRPQRSWWPYPSARAAWIEALGAHRLFGEPSAGFVVGACLLVRRSVFEALGGFDERFWLYGEEADLCARAEQFGWRVVLADDAIVEHEGGASGKDSSELVSEHFARGADRFVLDRGGRWSLVSYRLAGLAGSLIRWPVLRLRHPGDPRLAVRGRQIARTARALVRHPGSVNEPVVECEDRASRPEPHLVVLSLEAWDDVWRRNQFFVRELLEMHPELRVLWVEPASDPINDMRRTHRVSGRTASGVRPLLGEPRVMLFQPRKWLPRAIWPWVDESLTAQVRRAIRVAGLERPILWVNDCTYSPLVRSTGWRAVYDITDDWLDASMAPRQRRRLETREQDLIAVADEVVVCSPSLAQRRSATRSVHLVPNAVDAEHLRAPQPRPADLPPGPTAVYVGSLHEDRLDVDLVARIARSLPHLCVVLVGPNSLSRTSTDVLRSLSNVHLLGAKPYAAVPGYLQHADVIVVPHVVSPFTESLDPIKAYECLAVGRPTLATPVAGFRELDETITVADRDAFTEQLAHLLDVHGRISASATVVDQPVPSWRQRAEQFWAILAGDVTSEPPHEQRIRVVFVGHTAVPSGGELALARLIPGLDGVDAHVVLGEDGAIAAAYRHAGATVEVLPIDESARSVRRDAVAPGRLPLEAAVQAARYTWRLSRRLREIRPDIVHTNTLKAALYGGMAGRLAGIPVVWHIRDRIATDYLPRGAVRVIRALARVIPSAIVTNSESTRHTIDSSRIGRCGGPIVVVHDAFEPGEVPAQSHATDRFVVGMVGRLAPWKGQDVFLRAFAQAFPNGSQRAVVVGGALFGEDQYARRLQDLVGELQLGDRVELTGHVDDVSRRLAEMDVVVHASVIPEPFGQVVVEAMAAGRAVVAAAAGGPLEIVTDEVDGLLVPPGDVGALADALRGLERDDALRSRLGEHARRSAARFRPECIGPQVERVYRRVLGAGRR